VVGQTRPVVTVSDYYDFFGTSDYFLFPERFVARLDWVEGWPTSFGLPERCGSEAVST